MNQIAPIAASTLSGGPLAAMHPLDMWAALVGTCFLVLACAQWVASCYTDRLALRLFALRYALAALGWYLAHPHRMQVVAEPPLVSMVVVVGLIALTMLALDHYVGRFSWRRVAVQAAAALLAIAGLWWGLRLDASDPRPVYAVMSLGMIWCAGVSWRAARRERNAGHLIITLSFAAYPVTVLAAWLLRSRLPSLELAYVAALPAGLVGVAVLLASLIRFSHRLETELAQRQAAERQVRELNASLEQGVQDRTAELRQVVAGLESFTRNVSHDLRGPLAGVAGLARMAEQALHEGRQDEARRLLAPLAPQLEQLGSLVTDLLALSKVAEAGCVRSHQALRPVVDDALRQLRMAPESAQLLDRVQVQLDDLPDAEVDSGLMRQAYVNLLGNALRFAGQHATAPRVRAGAERKGRQLRLFVADNGPGFPAERADELFEPFVRLHGAGLSHNGIGLSIVRHIAQKHHARVWAENAPEGGAVFNIELELAV